MKVVLLLLGLLLVGCTDLGEYRPYNRDNPSDRAEMSKRIKKAYQGKDAKWDVNYENLMY